MKGGYRRACTALMLLYAAGAGCVTSPATGKKMLVVISREQEIAIGEQAAPQFEKEFGGRVANARLQKYVAEVGSRLAAVCEREMPYRFALLSSDVPNAFALPGGKIYLTAGLMRRMSNERQLAAVLGHETGHVADLHNVRALQRQMGAALLADLVGAIVEGKGGQAAEAAAKIAAGVANLHYSREDEYTADELGIRYMTRAGYNPWGMVELLTTLSRLSQSEPGDFGEMFQTHPLTSKRIERARSIIQAEHSEFSPGSADPNAARFLRMRALLISTLRARR